MMPLAHSQFAAAVPHQWHFIHFHPNKTPHLLLPVFYLHVKHHPVLPLLPHVKHMKTFKKALQSISAVALTHTNYSLTDISTSG